MLTEHWQDIVQRLVTRKQQPYL